MFRYALGNMDVVRTLVGAKGNLNAADNFGQTPIHQVMTILGLERSFCASTLLFRA